MSTLSLRLPDSLHAKVKELAEKDAVSINQFIAIAVAEKMAALLTLDYLAERGARGNRAVFEGALARVPSRPPVPGDELPPGWSSDRAVSASGRRKQPNRKRKGRPAASR